MAIISATGQARTASGVLAEARALVEPEHRAVVDRLPDLVRHVVGYHIGWWDAQGLPTGAGGKSIRSAVVLAAVGGDRVVAVPQAVAVELVHDFSLLHDDIMDGDLVRRHRPAAWSVFGISEALLAGDVLVSLACDVLAGLPGVKVLTAALLELCAGQSADMAFERRSDVGVEECVAMATAKTGALLACACELGALAGGGRGRQCQLLGRFGRHVGLAFQLVDDLLGIWGETAVTGKPAGSDLANRKKTLPVVAALASGTPAGDRLAQLYHHERASDPDTLAQLAGLIEEAGGRRWAQAEADRQLDRALTCLAQALPDESAATDLTALADLIVGRDR